MSNSITEKIEWKAEFNNPWESLQHCFISEDDKNKFLERYKDTDPDFSKAFNTTEKTNTEIKCNL